MRHTEQWSDDSHDLLEHRIARDGIEHTEDRVERLEHPFQRLTLGQVRQDLRDVHDHLAEHRRRLGSDGEHLLDGRNGIPQTLEG